MTKKNDEQRPRVEMHESVRDAWERTLDAPVSRFRNGVVMGEPASTNILMDMLSDALTEDRCDLFIDTLVGWLPKRLRFLAWPIRAFLDWATPGPMLGALRRALLERPLRR